MQSQPAKILIFETAHQLRRQRAGRGRVLPFNNARQVPAWHPLACLALWLCGSLGAWTAFFWLVGVL